MFIADLQDSLERRAADLLLSSIEQWNHTSSPPIGCGSGFLCKERVRRTRLDSSSRSGIGIEGVRVERLAKSGPTLAVNRTARVGQPKAFQRIERRPPARRYWRGKISPAPVTAAANHGRRGGGGRVFGCLAPLRWPRVNSAI